MSTILSKNLDGTFSVITDYSDTFRFEAKALGGKWNGASWVFADESTAREAITRAWQGREPITVKTEVKREHAHQELTARQQRAGVTCKCAACSGNTGTFIDWVDG